MRSASLWLIVVPVESKMAATSVGMIPWVLQCCLGQEVEFMSPPPFDPEKSPSSHPSSVT